MKGLRGRRRRRDTPREVSRSGRLVYVRGAGVFGARAEINGRLTDGGPVVFGSGDEAGIR